MNKHNVFGWTKVILLTGVFALLSFCLTVSAYDEDKKYNPDDQTYTVTYHMNGAPLGTPPVDSRIYYKGQEFTLLSHKVLYYADYTFSHWNSEADGTGTRYDPGETAPHPGTNLVLYAIWVNPSSCDLYRSVVPAGGEVNATNRTITATVNNNFTALTPAFDVSEGASWRLYEDSKLRMPLRNNTMALRVGENTAYVLVTAKDGSTKTYTLTVYRLGFSGKPTGEKVEGYSILVSGRTLNVLWVENQFQVTAPEGAVTADGIQFSVDLNFLDGLKSLNRATTLEVQAPFACLRIPLNITDYFTGWEEALKELNVEKKNTQLSVTMMDLTTYETYITTIEKNFPQGGILAGPVRFEISLVEKDTNRTLFQPVYFEEAIQYSIPLTGADMANWGGYGYDQNRKTWRFLPAHLVDAGGENQVALATYHNGVFAVVHNPYVYSDIGGHWAEREILESLAKGLVPGSANVRIDPDRFVTRGECVEMLVQAMALPYTGREVNPYPDMNPVDKYYETVAIAVDNHILTPYKNQPFNGGNLVTREEMAQMMFNAFARPDALEDLTVLDRFLDKEEILLHRQEGVAMLVERQLLQGDDGYFRPDEPVTLAEMAAILTRLVDEYYFVDEK